MTVLEQRALQAVSDIPKAIEGLKTPELLLLAGMAMQGILTGLSVSEASSEKYHFKDMVASSSLEYAEALMDAYNKKIKNK